MPDTLLRVVGASVVGSLLLAAGYYIRDAQEPGRRIAPPDTIERTRTITRTDTVTETVPRTIIRYDTVRATDTLTVPVPADFQMMGAIPPKPLDITTGEATLTYWTGERWQQSVYELPKDEWALWPEVEIRTTPLGLEATAAGALRWRDWTLSVGYTVMNGYSVARNPRGWTAGLRWQPVEVTW